jgi:hypothetical protein
VDDLTAEKGDEASSGQALSEENQAKLKEILPLLQRDIQVSYGHPWAHYLGGYQDRLLGGPLGLPDLCRTVPVGVRCKDYGGEVLG